MNRPKLSERLARWPASGTRLRLWLGKDCQAALSAYAEAHGLTLAQAARQVLDGWARIEQAHQHIREYVPECCQPGGRHNPG